MFNDFRVFDIGNDFDLIVVVFIDFDIDVKDLFELLYLGYGLVLFCWIFVVLVGIGCF